MSDITISKAEYMELVANATKLDIVMKVIREKDAYDGARILTAILKDDRKEEEE